MEREFKDSGIEWIGRIPKEWKISAIKHLMTLYAGATPKSDKDELWDGSIPWVTPADYKTEDVYVSKGRRNISVAGLSSCATTLLPINSIIFSKRAPIGLVVLNNEPLCTNQGCIGCVPYKQKANSKYYYYVLSVFTEQFELFGSGTTFKEISANNFANFIVSVPPLSEQQRIADYLDKKCGEIDELIALQEQMIAQLTDYKQSVITEAVTKGLNPDTELVPSGIDWIGDMPKGWKVCRIKDLFRLRTGTTPKEFEQGLDSDELVTWFTPSDVAEINCELDSSERHLSKEVIEKEGIELSPSGSLIFVGIGASAGKIGYATVDSYSNQQITTLIPPKNKCIGKYSYYYMIADRKRIRENAFFTTLPIINNSYLSGIKTLVPPLSEQQAIATYLDTKCSEIDSLIAIKQQKIETLKDYKKSVIYEAVTGKMNV